MRDADAEDGLFAQFRVPVEIGRLSDEHMFAHRFHPGNHQLGADKPSAVRTPGFAKDRIPFFQPLAQQGNTDSHHNSVSLNQ